MLLDPASGFLQQRIPAPGCMMGEEDVTGKRGWGNRNWEDTLLRGLKVGCNVFFLFVFFHPSHSDISYKSTTQLNNNSQAQRLHPNPSSVIKN